MRKLTVSLGSSDNFAKISQVGHTTWDSFAKFLARRPPETADKSSEGWYCPAEFNPVYRDGNNLVARHALTFDYDHIDPDDLDNIRSAYADYEYVMHTTASHTEDKPRVRVVFPLSRPVSPEEFGAVSRKIAARYNIDKLARESDRPAQMMFKPTVAPGATFWSARNNGGKWIDVDAVLGEYNDWKNREQWPRRSSGDDIYIVGDIIVPPDEKLGIVGDFCRAYRVPEAIERFELPYERGSSDTRWTYRSGSRPDGLRIYDNGLKAHSEHDTDPAHGQHNVFDLVRLHRFGDLDQSCDADTPITERPSYKAMCAFALDQREVQAIRVKTEFENLDPQQAAAPEVVETKRFAIPSRELRKNPTKPRWLIRDELERGVIAVMAGPRGSYKSFVALNWAMKAQDAGPVYVVSAEGNDIDRRVQAHLATCGSSDDGLYVAQRRVDLTLRENIEMIRRDCVDVHQIRPVLFVLDTFSKLSGAMDENSNTDVKAFIGLLDNGLKRAFDATVLLITHTGHGEKTRARGASALEADTDAAYIVRRQDDLVVISRDRFKSSPELEPMALRPEIVPLGYNDDDGQMVTSIVMHPADAPRSGVVKLEPRGMYAKNVLDTLRDMSKLGELVDVTALVEAAVKRLPEPGGVRDTRRQQTDRAVKKLVVDGYLHMHGTCVSLTPVLVAEDGDWDA